MPSPVALRTVRLASKPMVRFVMMIAIFVVKLVYAGGMAKQNYSFYLLMVGTNVNIQSMIFDVINDIATKAMKIKIGYRRMYICPSKI